MAKLPTDLKALARAHTEQGVRWLAHIAAQSTSDSARVAAIGLLFDRGWGKAPQSHTGADGEGDIRVIIRHIVESRVGQAQVIDAPIGTQQQLERPRDE